MATKEHGIKQEPAGTTLGYDVKNDVFRLVRCEPSGTLVATDDRRISDIDDASNPKYYGYVASDGSWLIMKEDSTAKTYRYAKGDSGYSAAWTARAGQSYDYFDV